MIKRLGCLYRKVGTMKPRSEARFFYTTLITFVLFSNILAFQNCGQVKSTTTTESSSSGSLLGDSSPSSNTTSSTGTNGEGIPSGNGSSSGLRTGLDGESPTVLIPANSLGVVGFSVEYCFRLDQVVPNSTIGTKEYLGRVVSIQHGGAIQILSGTLRAEVEFEEVVTISELKVIDPFSLQNVGKFSFSIPINQLLPGIDRMHLRVSIIRGLNVHTLGYCR